MEDALKPVATPAKAIDLLEQVRVMLATANLHLHEIASGHKEVTQAIPNETKPQTSAI